MTGGYKRNDPYGVDEFDPLIMACGDDRAAFVFDEREVISYLTNAADPLEMVPGYCMLCKLAGRPQPRMQ